MKDHLKIRLTYLGAVVVALLYRASGTGSGWPRTSTCSSRH